jgi:hypothetical protein
MRTTIARTDNDGTVFDMLADQARARTGGQLAVTTCGGAINALFFLQHLSAWWPGVAFIAIGAYGAWGLADRVVTAPGSTDPDNDLARPVAAVVRIVVAATGIIAALAAAAGFMAVAIGNWNH